MKHVIRNIYSFYAILLFTILLVPAFIAYIVIKMFVPYKKQIVAVYSVNQMVMRIWSPLVGLRYKCTGKENIKKDTAKITIYNHYSLLDVFAVNRHYSIAAKPLIKQELLKIPLLGWLFSMSAIPINRDSKSSKSKGMDEMQNNIKKGISVLIFPEGTRNRTKNALSDFKNGAFKLAVENNIAIQPTVILNTRKTSSPNSITFLPCKIWIHHLPQVYPSKFNFDYELLKQHCFNMMEEFIVKFDKSYESFIKD